MISFYNICTWQLWWWLENTCSTHVERSNVFCTKEGTLLPALALNVDIGHKS